MSDGTEGIDLDGEDGSAPGWEAINAGLAPIYGDQKPLHWGTVIKYRLGGPDPLDGISAYRRSEPVPHWHFVTYGFSELYAKESEDKAVSGFGFELTFRLRAGDESEPQPWVFNFLQNLARYVFSSGNGFDHGHYMNLNGPIALGADTRIRAIAFAFDPELAARETPHGHLAFLQVVGITLDELVAIKGWNTNGFLELAAAELPLLVTDLGRTSLLQSPALREAVERGRDAEGSSSGVLYLGAAAWKIGKPLFGKERLELTFGANGAPDLSSVLPGRLPFGHGLLVTSAEGAVLFRPGEACSWAKGDEGAIEVTLTHEAARQLAAALVPKAGTYEIPAFPRLTVRVVPSEIKDAEGKVVQVIG